MEDHFQILNAIVGAIYDKEVDDKLYGLLSDRLGRLKSLIYHEQLVSDLLTMGDHIVPIHLCNGNLIICLFAGSTPVLWAARFLKK